MDPQKLSQLDPKLRDAYQRVMGTVIPEPQVPAAQVQTPVSPPVPPTPPAPDPVPASIPQPTAEPQPKPFITPDEPSTPPVQEPPSLQPQAIPMPESAIPSQPTNFVQMNSEVASTPSQNFTAPSTIPQTQTITLKKKNGMMMPILFGIVILVFLAIYTLFWTRIFNLKLPFLP